MNKTIKTTFQTIAGRNFDVNKLDSISISEYKTEAVIISSNLVAKKNYRHGMYDLEELIGYLTEKALEIVEKFKPEAAANGWRDLGSFLYFTLSNRAKNFNEIQYNYLKGITTLEGESSEDGEENREVSTLLSKDEKGFSDVEFEKDNKFSELLTLLSTRQKLILKGRLEGLSGQPLADFVGSNKATVHRDLKKIQNIALSINLSF